MNAATAESRTYSVALATALDDHGRMRTHLLVVPLLTAACVPRQNTGDGGETTESSTGTTAQPETDTDTSTGSGTETGSECPAFDPPECDGEGRCWTIRDGWEAEAQSITWAEIQEGVDAGTLTPEPDLPGCWAYGDVDVAHTCVVELEDECALLIGRPVQEVELAVGPACEVAGAWSIAMVDTLDRCWGVFEGDLDVAVRLRLE